MSTTKQDKAIKGSFWGAVAFYFLIAFEFFYMAGPFAAYFYSAYAPALNFFNRSQTLSWLNSFFLPHAVRQTSSVVINALEVVGIILAVTGFLAFCIGAAQVYYHKLAKKGVVTGGIYNLVRHPQYASFIVCSLGLLILWPRYIVAIMFVTMIFAYYLLAKVEEKECEQKFGQSYIDFKNRTTMFLPFKLSFLPKLPEQKGKKVVTMLVMYVMTLITVLGIAKALNTLAINSLYAIYTENSANISICEMSNETLNEILEIAVSDTEIQTRLGDVETDTRFLNYILPTEWSVAEIPMNGVKVTKGHKSPTDYDRNLYKVIFTKAVIRGDKETSGKELLTNVYLREGICEVWVDLSQREVIQILYMPEDVKYQGVPVAVY